MKGFNNPFRIHGVVERDYFTDRRSELRRLTRTLREPGAKLLVYGHRRMGKTSALAYAIERVNRSKGHAFMAYLSTASTPIDIANRIIQSAIRTLGRRWRDLPQVFLKMIGAKISISIDPNTGLPTASFESALRNVDFPEQHESLGQALDAIESMAKDRGHPIGIVLDEFQEIHRFGGSDAEWRLRGIIQHHQNVSYILAGSQTHLINRMLEKDRAFYGLLDRMEFGPIDPAHLGRWIDSRLRSVGIQSDAVGRGIVETAGSRTRDIVQLARRCFDRSASAKRVLPSDVSSAFSDVIDESADLFLLQWRNFTRHQQNVLRSVAAGDAGITTKRIRQQFALGDSGTTANAAAALVEAGTLLKTPESAVGYTFDNPFFRGWVVQNTLADLGMG